MTRITERLRAGDRLLLDGGPGSELQRPWRWLDAGAQIAGGCCASGPEHILALRGVVDDAAAS